MVADSPLSEYNPFSLVPQIVTITLTVLIIVVLFSVYYKKLTNSNYRRINSGYVLTMQIFIEYIRGLVVTILGPKLEKTTPFFLYLFSYILISNLIGVLGFANPTGSLTVTLSLAFLSVVGTFAVGFRFQRASYLRKFVYSARIKKKSIPVMINPFGVISSVTPLISLSFRLWGNMFAGSLIMSLWFYMTQSIMIKIPYLGVINLLGGLTAVPLKMYFDLMSGVIQAMVFVLLTMVYWSFARGETSENTNK